MNKRLITLLLVAGTLIGYACYYYSAQKILSLNSTIKFITNQIQVQSGFKTNFKNLEFKMSLLPAIWVFADELSIQNETNKDYPLVIKEPTFKIELLPLIFGKTHIKYFSADNIQADFTIKQNNELYLGNYKLDTEARPVISINNSKILINSYKINLNSQENNNLAFIGEYFNLSKFKENKYIKLETATKCIANNKSTSNVNVDIDLKLPIQKHLTNTFPKLNITITNLNLNDHKSTIKYLSNGTISDINGIINFELRDGPIHSVNNNLILNFICKNFEINTKNLITPYQHKDDIEILSSFNALHDGLIINKFIFKTPEVIAEVNGNLRKISSNKPFLDLKIDIPKTRTEKVIRLLPQDKQLYKDIADINLLKLVQYPLYGDVTASLDIKGKADKPNIIGGIDIENAYLITPIKNAPKATIKINFDKTRLKVNSHVPTTNKEFVDVTGDCELYEDKNVNLLVSTTENINLETAEIVLVPLHEVLVFDLGPVPIMKIKGLGSANINIQGNKQNPILYGYFKCRNATANFNFMPTLKLENAIADLNFDKTTAKFITKQAFINNMHVKIEGDADFDGNFDFNFIAHKLNLSTLFNSLKEQNLIKDMDYLLKPVTKVTGICNINLNLKGKIKDFEKADLIKDIKLNGDILVNAGAFTLKQASAPINKINGKISLKNSNATIDLSSYLGKSKFLVTGKTIDDKVSIDITSNVLHFDDVLKLIDSNKIRLINPETSRTNKVLNFNAQYNGLINKLELDKLKCKARFLLKDTQFLYVPQKLPISVISGIINLNGDVIRINKVNARALNSPLLLDGEIKNIFKTPEFKLYLNSKPTQELVDVIFNKNEIYPIKIKGDVSLFSTLKGTQDKISTKSKISLAENSSLYYIGAKIGDALKPVNIVLNADISPNRLQIEDFYYDKIIRTNKDVISRQLTAKGEIRYTKDLLYFNNFCIKTEIPTDVKIFNVIFKKPLIQKGLFESNIRINGSSASPIINGPIIFKGLEVPFWNTNLDHIRLNFTPKSIILNAEGDIFSHKFDLNGDIKNELKPPLVINKINLHTSNLDLNKVVANLKNIEIELNKQKIMPQNFAKKKSLSSNSLIIQKAELTADDVFIKNIHANDLVATLSINKNQILKIDSFKFDLAEGTINGNLTYNLLNNELFLGSEVTSVNANLLSDALLGLKNQIYGNLNGDINLICNANSNTTCMQTLSGFANFKVKHGKMPKLGSLEYLLKASNLLKSGITGLSVSNLVNLVTPLKTGEFEEIKGEFKISNGIADKVQIYSIGKDLSLFLNGKYNLSTYIADLTIYGRLTKKYSNILGPVGNASLNALFNLIPGVDLTSLVNRPILNEINKIPGIELNNKSYRIFMVDILGNINAEDYVKSFKWLE